MNHPGLKRVRLSEWARHEGISRITAYRMLRRGILPVPSERSPTGRWYVLLPADRVGRVAIYTRSAPGPGQITNLNQQIVTISEWVIAHHRTVYTTVREIVDPAREGRMPRLELLLSDRQIAEILIASPAVVGRASFALLVAALAPQGRRIVTVKP